MFTQLLTGAKLYILKHGRISTMIIKCEKRANTANVQDEHRQKLWSAHFWESSTESMAFLCCLFHAKCCCLFNILNTWARNDDNSARILNRSMNFFPFFAQFLLSSRQKKCNRKKIEVCCYRNQIPFQISPIICTSVSTHIPSRDCLQLVLYNLIKPGKNQRRKKETEITLKVFVLLKKSFF